ncbi:MAG: trypsin-like peptidase domain-containing protein [Pirellulales bacterium]
MRLPASRNLVPMFGILAIIVSVQTFSSAIESKVSASELRNTPIVKAVQNAKASIVNIHGHKTIASTNTTGNAQRQVNGMGTGVVVDPRGYIVTNFHVVEGVRRIQVTLSDGKTFIGQLISHDRKTDLAIIKIITEIELPVIDIGTSDDLMPGETVIAVGNAYGYENSVTQGIISALHREVQVTDTQKYYDLIQTDASINPGNSGGPLLNIDGQMIGINVAVRVGAQGIGFAIPADTVMKISADLLSVESLDNHWHGIVGKTRLVNGKPSYIVDAIDKNSPAAQSGIKSGDRIQSIEDVTVGYQLDIERALLNRKVGEEVTLKIIRNEDQPKQLSLVVKSLTKSNSVVDLAWKSLGVRVKEIPKGQFDSTHTSYHGGLSITAIRANSPATQQGIHIGDILLGMHEWETVSLKDLEYILSSEIFAEKKPLKFYILRENETLFGHIAVSSIQYR